MRELDGYRRQLSNSYLMDREVTDKLIREVYERIQKDVFVSHILIALPSDAPSADTLVAYKKAMTIKKKLDKGEDFERLALQYSNDQTVKENKGLIGFVTALFPNGFYNMESAVYSLKPGQVSKPVRSKMGYHIIEVRTTRKARGEIEAAHILIRTQSKKKLDPKSRIDSIYNRLHGGDSFEDLAKKHSEDKVTARKGGYLGFFGINQYDAKFENMAFYLKNDGEFTEPFQSSVGWQTA